MLALAGAASLVWILAGAWLAWLTIAWAAAARRAWRWFSRRLARVASSSSLIAWVEPAVDMETLRLIWSLAAVAIAAVGTGEVDADDTAEDWDATLERRATGSWARAVAASTRLRSAEDMASFAIVGAGVPMKAGRCSTDLLIAAELDIVL